MSLDNSNPIVHVLEHKFAAQHDIFANDAWDLNSSPEGEDTEELIDSEEIFGTATLHIKAVCLICA